MKNNTTHNIRAMPCNFQKLTHNSRSTNNSNTRTSNPDSVMLTVIYHLSRHRAITKVLNKLSHPPTCHLFMFLNDSFCKCFFLWSKVILWKSTTTYSFMQKACDFLHFTASLLSFEIKKNAFSHQYTQIPMMTFDWLFFPIWKPQVGLKTSCLVVKYWV